MKKITLLFLAFIFIAGITFSQEKAAKPACLKVSSFSSSIGFSTALTSNTNDDYYTLKNTVENPDIFIDITNFKIGDPEWAIGMLNGDFSGFSYHGMGSGNGSLLFNLGLTPYSHKLGKYRENRELRFSVGGNLGTRNTFYYYQDNQSRIGTYQSEFGNIVFGDSLVRKYYTYSLDFADINIGFSYLFKTDVTRRFHFYTGIGANYGISIRSNVTGYEDIYQSVIYYAKDNEPTEEDINYYLSNEDNYDHSSTTWVTSQKNPMQFGRIYIPLGVELKLSKKPESFFNHADLYAELNPGVEIQVWTGEKTYVNPYFGMAFIGFRYHW
jgi:hypothetical protein